MVVTYTAYADDGSGGRHEDGDPAICYVMAEQYYDWRVSEPPHNNYDIEKSLYTWDYVTGVIRYNSAGCNCGVTHSGPTAVGDWSHIDNTRDTGNVIHYRQHLVMAPDGRPVPTSQIQNSMIYTAEYDDTGRERTHWLGTTNGTGLVDASKFSITGKVVVDPVTNRCEVAAHVTIHSDMRYRNPFWETSIHEHHIYDAQGYPASNLDYSNYQYDAIPLEVGSNLALHGYRHDTIQITHEVSDMTVEEFHCDAKTCDIRLDGRDATDSYVGHIEYIYDARNLPWAAPNPGQETRLDEGESFFVVSATRTGPLYITATMTNQEKLVAQGYNVTYQFVPEYNPVLYTTAITNTAFGGDHAWERPVSVIIQYNGTIPNTTHYCTVSDVYDTDGSLVPYGDTGGVDMWGQRVGEPCPARDVLYGEHSIGTSTTSYVSYPAAPISYEWGRFSAINPETRAELGGFVGVYTICDVYDNCTTHDTPYLNWDYVPETARDFVPHCVIDSIAGVGGNNTNIPKPKDWYNTNTGEGAEPHSYRGLFAGLPGSGEDSPPQHYVVDSILCNHILGMDRECTVRGAECLPTHDRICEDVFQPFLYPDDYIISGHDRLESMVIQWCGEEPDDECILESYATIDDVMVELCKYLGVTYEWQSPVIDMSLYDDGHLSDNTCHAMISVGLYEPALYNGTIPADWADCYDEWGEATLCTPTVGDAPLVIPVWDDTTHMVYVPYTPTTGAFGGIVERPGTMLSEDGSLYCACDDTGDIHGSIPGNNICDVAETATSSDLNKNGVADDWEMLTTDGVIQCLDRTGILGNALADCWAKHGRDPATALQTCLQDAHQNIQDGPDGYCDPALIIPEYKDAPDYTGTVLPFQTIGDDIVIPYVVDGMHEYCDVAEPWCISSGDTIPNHAAHNRCYVPGTHDTVKRIPAPSTIPPLYQPIFDEQWPPACLPDYYTIHDIPTPHQVSGDIGQFDAEWPVQSPSHVGIANSTMMLHAGTGVIRFDVCETCDVHPADTIHWNGNITTGDILYTTEMEAPSNIVQYDTHYTVRSVVPCDAPVGWCIGGGINLTLTAYPEQKFPVTVPHEMVVHECMIDGDGGRSVLSGPTKQNVSPDLWNGLSCRDRHGVSVTIQDYEGARHGPAAKREAGQPWTISRGTDDVSVKIFRNGLWLNTLGILQYRGQCTEYVWAPHVTPGHTTCPATTEQLTACMRDGISAEQCAERLDTQCTNVFVQDGIHKQWEFPESYFTEDTTHKILGCENIPDNESRIISIQDIDYNTGGSFACQNVQACAYTITNYKCIGGKLEKHVICDVPEQSFSILDVPYEEVMYNVAPQMLHIEAVCPSTATDPRYDTTPPGCHDTPIHDTHRISESAGETLIYVDYYGVGRLDVHREADTIRVTAPQTFGVIQKIWHGDVLYDTECTTCIMYSTSGGTITIQNIYGAQLSGVIPPAGPVHFIQYDLEMVGGALWLFLPAIIVGVVLYCVIKRLSGLGAVAVVVLVPLGAVW